MNEVIENTEPTNETPPTDALEMSAESRFIGYLKGLNKPPQNRAALAHLRRGLGKPPKTAMEMFPYLGRFLSHDTKPNYENTVFIIAALFAYYPDAKHTSGNLGASLRELTESSDSIEKRFVALLNAETEDLPYYLRQIIGLLKSNDIGVNWEKLFFGVQNWKNENLKETIQSQWAKQFWGNFTGKNQDNQNSQPKTGETNK